MNRLTRLSGQKRRLRRPLAAPGQICVMTSDLRGVVAEDDGAEVTAVVVGDEVLGGVGGGHAACPDALVL